MHSDSEIIYDSEPERVASSQITSTRSHLRRTSDERPGLSSEGSTAAEGIRRKKGEQEVLILDSDGSEDELLPPTTANTKSKYFVSSSSSSSSSSTTAPQPKSPTKRRRTRSPPPPTQPNSLVRSPEGWPFSGQVRIGSRSPPPPPLLPSSQRQKSRSLSFSTTSSPNEPILPLASTSKPDHHDRGSSPFVTARDLLNSRSTSLDSNRSLSPRYPEPTTKSKRSTSLKGQDSASSIEIIESFADRGKGKEKKKKKKLAEKEKEEESEEDDDDLPDPADWVKQFSLKRDGGGKGKKKEESMSAVGEGGGGGKRKKPWEVMEAKATTTKKSTLRKPVVKKKVVKAKKEEEESEDDDEVEIVSSRARSTSTALKPSPSGRIPQFTLSTTIKKQPRSTSTSTTNLKDSTLFSIAPPIQLPSDDRIKCLSHCPLCAFSSTHQNRPRTTVDSWGTKSLSTRSNHLRLCSKSHDYTSETVSHLISQQILTLAKESEGKRLEKELGKSLFARAIGRGEGTSGKDVSVVGVEGEGDWKGVQEEVDAWRKKGKRGGIEDRLRRVAREIKLELEDLEVVKRGELGKKEEDRSEEDEDKLELPRATGRLRPETEEDRSEVSKRARELLDLAKGTGLTQALQPPVMVLDDDSTDVGKISSIEEEDATNEDDFLPPATQTFEPSTLANRCKHDGAINILRPLASSPPDSKGKGKRARSRSPIPELDLAFSSDEEDLCLPKKTSLWKANAGIDEDSLKRVVHSHSRPSGSPPPPPRSSSPFISPTTALHPLSTLTLSSASSSTSSLAHPSTLLQIGSSRNLATSRRNSPSPTRRKGKGKEGVIEEGVKRLGLGEPRSEFGALSDGMEWMDDGEDDAWGDGGGVLVGGVGEGAEGRREGEAESSEEESLINLIARSPTKSTSKNRKTPSPRVSTSKPSTSSRRKISPSSPSVSSDSSLPPPSNKPTKNRGDPPTMPTYSSLPLTTLQKEVQKYGFRPSKEKSVLVSQLKDVWRAINKDKVEAWDKGEETVKKTRKKKAVEEKDGGEVKKTKGRRKRGAVVEEEVEEEPGETRTVGQRLRELIVNDEELYCRILRYEPIHIDEFILLAANNNVKVARMLLIRCLDEQSITFYQEDPTNGQRKRHR